MEFITTQEAAQILGTSREWIARLCKNSKLDCRRPGHEWQVNRESVEAYKTAAERGDIRPGPRAGQ